MEALEEKQRVLLQQLDAVTRREAEVREDTTQLEKSLTMAKHDMKEVGESSKRCGIVGLKEHMLRHLR